MAISMKELNLEQGMPTVDTALRWLEAELHAARKMGRPGLKLIHGYGSSGTGGKIRTACRKYLRREAEAGRVRLVIRGEDFSIFSEETRRSFTLCAQLRADRDLERENRGVTFVIQMDFPEAGGNIFSDKLLGVFHSSGGIQMLPHEGAQVVAAEDDLFNGKPNIRCNAADQLGVILGAHAGIAAELIDLIDRCLADEVCIMVFCVLHCGPQHKGIRSRNGEAGFLYDCLEWILHHTTSPLIIESLPVVIFFHQFCNCLLRNLTFHGAKCRTVQCAGS